MHPTPENAVHGLFFDFEKQIDDQTSASEPDIVRVNQKKKKKKIEAKEKLTLPSRQTRE